MPYPPDLSAFTVLRRHQVEAATGFSRSTIYLNMARGLWPKAVTLGPRMVGWPAREVAAILNARIAGATDEDIRRLVVKLETQRAGAQHRTKEIQ